MARNLRASTITLLKVLCDSLWRSKVGISSQPVNNVVDNVHISMRVYTYVLYLLKKSWLFVCISGMRLKLARPISVRS